MAIVSKKYRFSAAHQLPNHAGKCRNLHGHNYTVEVCVEGDIQVPVPSVPSSSEGMVVDFGDIDNLVKPWIEFLDHRFLNEVLTVPTAEVIGLWLLSRLPEFITTIEVQETENCFATVDRIDLTRWYTRGGGLSEK